MFCEYKKFPFWIIKFPRKDRSLSQNVIDLQNCTPPKTIRHLRRFLGMLNVYRRFIPQAASQQAPLHNLLSGPKVKATTPITWMSELHAAFQSYKESLAHATLLAHPHPSAPLALVTVASTTAMGAVLQQLVRTVGNPLHSFPVNSPQHSNNTARISANC